MTPETGLDPDEAFDAVARRASVMECLMSGPKYNRDLRDELDISRSTAYKAVSELEDLNITRRGDEGYELTVLGELLFKQYREFHSRFQDICRPGKLLALLAPETEIPFALVAEAEVYTSEPHAPGLAIREVERVVTEASTLKGTGPVVFPRYVELFTDQLISDELEAELIYEQPVYHHLISEYEEDFKKTLRRDNLDVRVTDTELPFALMIIEKPTRKVAIVIYDDSGGIQGFIVNDSESAYAWGCDKWEEYQDGATKPPFETKK